MGLALFHYQITILLGAADPVFHSPLLLQFGLYSMAVTKVAVLLWLIRAEIYMYAPASVQSWLLSCVENRRTESIQ